MTDTIIGVCMLDLRCSVVPLVPLDLFHALMLLVPAWKERQKSFWESRIGSQKLGLLGASVGALLCF